MEEIVKRIEEIELQVAELQREEALVTPAVRTNADRLSFPLNNQEKSAINTQIILPIATKLEGTTAATAANYSPFFTADKSYQVVAVVEVHGTLGTDAGAVTLQLEKLTGTQAPDAGTVLLSTAFNLKSTINTVQYGSLVTTDAVFLGRGDRLCLKDSGTLTAVADLQLTAYIQQI